MRLYRYFNIGAGILVKYGSSKFSLTYSVDKEFSHTQTKNVRDQQEAERLKQKEKGKSKKQRGDHVTCTLIFCENPSCIDVFESRQAYEEHLLSEKHTFTPHETSMDRVKASYVERIKASSNLHSSLAPTEATRKEIVFDESVKETPLLQETGLGSSAATILSLRIRNEVGAV